MEEIIIQDGVEKMDLKKVTKMLSNAFWCPGIKIDEVKKGSINSALVVGAFMQDENQVGYARVISDRTRFAYIVDVYVDENYRKKGIGQKLIKYILSHNELKDVYQWLFQPQGKNHGLQSVKLPASRTSGATAFPDFSLHASVGFSRN